MPKPEYISDARKKIYGDLLVSHPDASKSWFNVDNRQKEDITPLILSSKDAPSKLNITPLTSKTLPSVKNNGKAKVCTVFVDANGLNMQTVKGTLDKAIVVIPKDRQQAFDELCNLYPLDGELSPLDLYKFRSIGVIYRVSDLDKLWDISMAKTNPPGGPGVLLPSGKPNAYRCIRNGKVYGWHSEFSTGLQISLPYLLPSWLPFEKGGLLIDQEDATGNGGVIKNGWIWIHTHPSNIGLQNWAQTGEPAWSDVPVLINDAPSSKDILQFNNLRDDSSYMRNYFAVAIAEKNYWFYRSPRSGEGKYLQFKVQKSIFS